MGGTGSGRKPGHGARKMTKDALPLAINRLARLKLLAPENSQYWSWSVRDRAVERITVNIEPGGMTVSCRLKNSGQDSRQWVGTQTTPCTLGGHRYWFTCPRCDRRVAILYRLNRAFACRHCQNLTYACQGESLGDRAIRRADKIRARLGWVPGIAHASGIKPAGMHWRTYLRLRAEHDALVMLAYREMARQMGLLKRRLVG